VKCRDWRAGHAQFIAVLPAAVIAHVDVPRCDPTRRGAVRHRASPACRERLCSWR
jgi:hypothetical protein